MKLTKCDRCGLEIGENLKGVYVPLPLKISDPKADTLLTVFYSYDVCVTCFAILLKTLSVFFGQNKKG